MAHNGKITIVKYTTEKPLNMIGELTGVCWNSPIDDASKNIERAMDCLESGHGRTAEFPDIYMIIDGYSARVMREFYTHIGGSPTRLQSSTRYVDAKTFKAIIPPSISSSEKATNIYNDTIESIRKGYTELLNLGVDKEDAAMLLPLGMESKMVDKCNFRHLMDMSRQRMCNRAYWEYRKLFKDICKALSEYSSQWDYLIKNYCYPKCEVTKSCPEKRGSCGRHPRIGK